jgi:hypothetical protein
LLPLLFFGYTFVIADAVCVSTKRDWH